MKRITEFLVLILIAFLLTNCADYTDGPHPTVNSAVENLNEYPDGFFPAEEAFIQVTVDGSTLTSPTVKAKVDIVFILDRSGSIEGTDPNEVSKQVIEEILPTLNPSQHRTNVVTFSDEARFVCNDITTLSTNFSGLSTCLHNIASPTGFTNIAAAMSLANTTLSTTGANHRIAILFTDGYPESESSYGYDMDQDTYITNTIIPGAILKDIAYYVVYLNSDTHIQPGSVEESNVTSLISNICSRTGGQGYTIDNVNQLQGIFNDIIEDNENSLYLKNVSMNLHINDAYTLVNTSSYITTGLTYQVNGNQITTNPISSLPQNQRISLTFKTTALEPIPPEAEVLSTNIPIFTGNAKILYDLGDGVQQSEVVPQISIKWIKPPMVLVKKIIEPSARQMTIKVINYIRDTEISDISLWEIVSSNMEIKLNTCNPIPNRIFSPSYKSNNTFDYIPEMLYYKLGKLNTFETAIVKFNFSYYGSTEGTVATDLMKPSATLLYTLPDGTRKELQFVEQCGDNNECWQGERTINAAEYALEDEILLPDFNIDSPSYQPQKEYEFDLPIAMNNHIWNDSQHNGWLPSASAEVFTNPDPFYIENKNRVWFHIDQSGNGASNANLIVKLYINDEFSFSYSDYTDDGWILLGQKELPTDNEIIIDFIEFNPQEVLSGDMYDLFFGLEKACYKLVIDYPGEELRKNNNVAFKEIRIVNE
ncbi:MAG TPA: vWA domain-containing protein [Bacteroidales bacterium]|nr:vWA domain-containing protein [Bacteroidales bacterium]